MKYWDELCGDIPALFEGSAAVVGEAALRAEADDARQSALAGAAARHGGLHHAELVHVVHHDVAPIAEPVKAYTISYLEWWSTCNKTSL